jgi:hypothetical protein
LIYHQIYRWDKMAKQWSVVRVRINEGGEAAMAEYAKMKEADPSSKLKVVSVKVLTMKEDEIE